MRVLLIGAVNLHGSPRGGEEYKNQLLYTYLCRSYNIFLIDTYQWKHRPLVVFKLFYQIFFYKWDKIVISASSYSVFRLMKLLQYFPTISKKTIYFVIGGYFSKGVLNGTFKIKPYETLQAIIVEGEGMKRDLIQAGYFGTIHVISNFKYFPKVVKNLTRVEEHIKFLFLSRIHPSKGISEIIKASTLLNTLGCRNYSITFFGPIDPSFRSLFESQMGTKLVYGGVLDIMNDTENAYAILSSFDIMLFPTYWKGEGFPGVLIDAFIAGLPVIASDWNLNNEIIQNEINGLLIPVKDYESLGMAMKRLIEDKELYIKLSTNAHLSAERFHIDRIWPQICEILEA